MHVLVYGSRTGPRGHKPNGGHERAEKSGLCRSTDEPADNEGRPSAEAGEGRGAD